ncbi:MAG TPA: 16S rRNA (cytidine(1402)-2'-O)-methyltransferase [Candidatus Acidoferrales bacterium]|nr:16S rRNA (cytidine(1402)-2'-O)-methyltransferase [Candidatus Acidoferrales bacterium]
MAGTLYVVATPIGNLEDITLRALRILKVVDLIAAEDTRRTRQLLTHYGISKPLISYFDHAEGGKSVQLVEQLKAGKQIALVSDAGTPVLSDPGFKLVQAAIQNGIRIVPVPGPSALTAALSVSGLPVQRFAFEGFLPARKKERRERLSSLREEARTLVFFEAPHRLQEFLADALEVLGDRGAMVARELTKIHEELIYGRLSELIQKSAGKAPKGELTVLIAGRGEEKLPTEELLRAEIERLQKQGLRVKEIAELLGERFSYPKREIYRIAVGSR